MAIVKQYHKDTDTTYVYESISYWDAEKQQSRSKRRVIGKLDPETGEIIPTGKRGRKKQQSTETEAPTAGMTSEKETQLLIRKQQIEISTLKEQVAFLKDENRQLRAALTKAGTLAEKLGSICSFTESNN